MFTAAKYRAMALDCHRVARDLDAKSRADLKILAREYDDQAAVMEREERLKTLLVTS
jgi:hypothetical protein